MNHARKVAAHWFVPGDLAPQSGIYEVMHNNCPSRELQMIFVAGQSLPPCPRCRSQVRFQLQRAIPHISQDRDFKG